MFVFTTDFIFYLSEEVKDFFLAFGFSGAAFDDLLANEDARKYSQIAGVFNKKGQTDMISVSSHDGNFLRTGVQGRV